MEYAVKIIDDKLILPDEIKGWIENGESLTAFIEGDALILKQKKQHHSPKSPREDQVL